MNIRIGYEHLDSLLTYPDVANLSGSVQPIRMGLTYPEACNLSGCAARLGVLPVSGVPAGPGVVSNVARNSPARISGFEIVSLESCGFVA